MFMYYEGMLSWTSWVVKDINILFILYTVFSNGIFGTRQSRQFSEFPLICVATVKNQRKRTRSVSVAGKFPKTGYSFNARD